MSRGMKIGINALSHMGKSEGVKIYIRNLISYLAQVDKENEYIIFVGLEVEKLKSINKNNFNFVIFPFPFLLKLIIIRFIVRIFTEHIYIPIYSYLKSLDVVHFTESYISILPVRHSIVTIHDITIYTHSRYHPITMRFYLKPLLAFSLRKSDLIISDSKSTKDEIIKIFKIDPNKIKVIYLGVEKRFKKLDSTYVKSELKKKYSIDYNYIFYIGNLEPRKNINSAIEAFSTLKKREKLDHKFIIAGKKAWLYKKIFKVIKRLKLENEVIFTGFIPDNDVPLFLNGADVFVYPAWFEGFGLPVLEAIACGTPVVASNVSSIPEILNNGAILVDPKNILSIAGGIEKFLKNEQYRIKTSRKGLERAKKFKWEETAIQTLEVYKKIA
jgi:glycosyltransferase involved in cell wall biosynthesis